MKQSGGITAAAFAAFALLSHLLALVSLLILSNALGPERYGVVSAGLALQSYLFLVGTVGVKPIVVREGIQTPERLDEVFTAHFFVTGICSVFATLAVLVVLLWIPVNPAERFFLRCLALGNLIISVNIQPFFDLYHQQWKSAAIVLTVELAALMGTVLLRMAAWLDVGSVGMLFAGKWAAVTLSHYLCYNRTIRRIRYRFSPDEAVTLLRSGWPVLVAALVTGVPFQGGVLLVRYFHGPTQSALLALGQQAALAYALATTIGVRLIQPHVCGGRGLERGLVGKIALGYAAFLGLLLVGMVSSALLIVYCLLDVVYRPSLLPMLTLLGAAFLSGLGGLTGLYLIAHKQERFLMAAQTCSAIFYVAVSVSVVPRWSADGAAGATLLSAGLTCTLLLLRLRICVSDLRGLSGCINQPVKDSAAPSS